MVDQVGEIKQIIADALQLEQESVDNFDESTVLLGSIPELDSMGVVTLITAFEDHYGIFVEDDEITADTFETFGSLLSFIRSKI